MFVCSQDLGGRSNVIAMYAVPIRYDRANCYIGVELLYWCRPGRQLLLRSTTAVEDDTTIGKA